MSKRKPDKEVLDEVQAIFAIVEAVHKNDKEAFDIMIAHVDISNMLIVWAAFTKLLAKHSIVATMYLDNFDELIDAMDDGKVMQAIQRSLTEMSTW